MQNRVLIVLAIVLGVTVMPAGARAPEEEFIGRFGGAWSGTAMIDRGDASIELRCRAVGKPGQNQIAINGWCSLFIASVRIAAEVTYDPATRRYAGILDGAPVGPAKMIGRRSGNIIHLTVHWPKPVNGQMEAQLSITNPGDGHLHIVLEEDPERTTQLVLSRT